VLIDIGAGEKLPRIPSWQNQQLFFCRLSNQKEAERLCRRTLNMGVAMQYRKELLPLAVMGSLSAAIMVVFAVTVMH
jgi:hypothetical protein